jgi:molecular chaperone GrpE (heat shock protein)
MPPKETLIAISAGLGLVLIAGGILLVWRKITRQSKSGDQAENHPALDRREFVEPDVENTALESPPIVEPEKPPEAAPSKEPKSAVERLAALSLEVPDSDLKEFLKEIAERVKETGPIFDDETSFNFIEEIVDRLDDLRAIQTNHQEPTPRVLEFFRKILVGVLSECGAELIHSAHWDPAQQRAITKEPTSGLEAPTICRHGSTGIRRNGQLLRKQEVVLAVPITN